MKMKFTLLLATALICFSRINAQNTFPSTGSVGIGTTAPDASSLLEIKSTSKGLLIPRMTKAQRDAISSPATGLMIYQINAAPGFYYYDGTKWSAVSTSGASRTLGNLIAPTAINADLLPNIDSLQNIGSLMKSWRDAYFDGAIYLAGSRFLAYQPNEGNIILGPGTLNTNTTGTNNTAIGLNALNFNTTGGQNTATGNFALHLNTTGYENVANGLGALENNTAGSNNTGNGVDALYHNTTGSDNVANGSGALYSNTTGFSNTASGENALFLNTIGSNNTANGLSALYNNTTGNFNTANGLGALFNNTTGSTNHSYGFYSLFNNTTGNGNLAIGNHALYSNVTCSNQLAIGDSALYNSVLNNNFATEPNVAIGSAALFSNTAGYDNTALGYQALYSNTVGSANTAVGHLALHSNTYAQFNTAVGETTLYYNTGYGNTALGYAALDFNTTASNNVAVGDYALAKNTTGYSNTASGAYSLSNNTKGSYNTSVGDSAAINDSVSSYNTEIGKWAGFIPSGAPNGNSNTFIGYFTGPTTGGFTNCTALGNSATPTASNQIRFGDGTVTSIGGQVSYTTFSDGRFKKNIKQNVPGLAFINQLKPVTYTLDIAGIKHFKGEDKKDNSAATKTEDAQNEKTIHTGFIAQDVEATAKKMNYDFDGVDAAKSDKDLYGLRYSEFVVPLVKAVQELTKMNEAKDSAISNLQKQIDDLKAMIGSGNQSSSNAISQVNKQTVELSDAATLSQNIPNPFTNSTVINYYLPVNNGNTYINFYGINGTLLKTVKLSGNGKGSINIKANELAAGIYHYALMVDGRVIDSKQMISSK